MGNLRRMLARAMRTSPWDDGKKDREWGMTKRRQRRIEQRETEQLVSEATRTRSQTAGECDECDSYTTNPVVNGCLLCDRCLALLPDPVGICHGPLPPEPAEVQSMADGDRHVVKTPPGR